MLRPTVNTHRQILRATSIVGGATFGALLISLVRNKAIALIGGPEAIGLIGIFTSVITFAGAIAALGLDTSAVRLLSQNASAPEKVARVRLAIWTLAWPLAVLGGALLWMLREAVSLLVIGNAAYADAIGWLGIGVAATVLGSAQMAIIQADGRVGDVARVKLWSALIATCFSVAAVYWLGLFGLAVAAIAVPIAGSIVSQFYSRRARAGTRPSRDEIVDDWRSLASVGVVVMLTFATSSAVNLAERSIVMRELGASAAGHFQASAAILWVNLSLVLTAMGADYYPRLSKAAVETPESLNKLVNQQLEVIWVLAAPVLLFVSVAAPLVLNLLYSPEFSESALLLRLLVVAGAIRLPIFAFGYFILAKSGGGSFWWGELAGALMLPLVWFLATTYGLPGIGVGVVIVAISTCLVYLWSSRASGVAPSTSNTRRFLLVMPVLAALPMLFEYNQLAGCCVGIAALLIVSWQSFGRLRKLWSQ